MPNWCENDLSITGPDVEKVAKFIRSSSKDDESARIFDFTKVIPYPESFLEQDRKAHEYEEKTRALDPLDPEFNAKLEALDKEYSAEPSHWVKDGYNQGGHEWCIANWDTKWNACETKVNHKRKKSMSITFSTAWSPPIKVIEKLAEKFPEYEFDLQFYECGMRFQGSYQWAGGENIGESNSDYRGHRGG